ncbi:hypothetical protein ABLG96_10755 [Nakamurella sp. A5-74]|uniref:Uncharacterized protein n=1 Tax=Nakamurella sp. A5-74 TaxID=3158264 RepID=A0AAU8DUJ9_9ACTN
MTSSMLDGISSGSQYRVTRVDGRLPDAVDDFVGPATLLIHHADQHLQIHGAGQLDPSGSGVHFYQKDSDHEGRDVRIWQIRQLGDHQMIAEHLSGI